MSTEVDRLTVARLGSEVVSLGQVLRRGHGERFRRMIGDAIRERIIERAIVDHDVRVHADELERARAVFAADRGLTTSAETDRWLKECRMTGAELDEQLRRIIAFGKLKELVVGDRAEGADRSTRAALHRKLFEEWLEEQWNRLGVEITIEEVL
jgi:hypothetical protein